MLIDEFLVLTMAASLFSVEIVANTAHAQDSRGPPSFHSLARREFEIAGTVQLKNARGL